ncbi:MULTISPECIES: zinc ribbon domain-containing protein, partial [Bifidobacterium]|uniref:zinc ribbon domain-containing protein n=1 Tax=Bifidobacterium TaxID=1678 RepID=UPI0013D5AA9E
MEDKYCRFCGAELHEEALFCSKCGKATAVESSAVESDITLDEEGGRNGRDVKDESGHDTDNDEPHWWNRSDDQANQKSETAQERRSAQQKQKWNRRRIIVIVVAALLALFIVVTGILWPKMFPKEFPAGINTYAVKGEPYYQWKRKLPHVAKIVDECHQYGYTGELTSSTQLDSVLFMPKSDRLLITYDWGLSLDSGDISAYGESTEKAMNCMTDALGYQGNLSAMLDEFAQDNKKTDGIESLDEVSPRALTNNVAARCMWTIGDADTSIQRMGRFLCALTEEKVSGSSSDTASSGDSSGDSSSERSEHNRRSESRTSDDDFADLWKTTVDDSDWSKIAGDYCRADGVCVHIAKNDSYDPNIASDETPGALSFASGDSSSNPLPNGRSQVKLGFQYQTKQTMPSSPEPFPMFAGCQGSMGCEQGSQEGVFFVMPGVDMQYFQRFSIDSNNPPDNSRDYLVIGHPEETTISDQSVFYRK